MISLRWILERQGSALVNNIDNFRKDRVLDSNVNKKFTGLRTFGKQSVQVAQQNRGLSSLAQGDLPVGFAGDLDLGSLEQALKTIEGSLEQANLGNAVDQAIIEQLRAGIPQIVDASDETAMAIITTFKKALEISSPSKVAQRLAGYVGEGVSLGLLGSEPMVARSATAIANVIPESISQALGICLTRQTHYGADGLLG